MRNGRAGWPPARRTFRPGRRPSRGVQRAAAWRQMPLRRQGPSGPSRRAPRASCHRSTPTRDPPRQDVRSRDHGACGSRSAIRWSAPRQAIRASLRTRLSRRGVRARGRPRCQTISASAASYCHAPGVRRSPGTGSAPRSASRYRASGVRPSAATESPRSRSCRSAPARPGRCRRSRNASPMTLRADARSRGCRQDGHGGAEPAAGDRRQDGDLLAVRGHSSDTVAEADIFPGDEHVHEPAQLTVLAQPVPEAGRRPQAGR